jgi:sec-independent protein translocase protein TatA
MGMNVGPLEIGMILVIALLVLGPSRLPDAARAVGKGVREFRESLATPELEEPDEPDEDDEEPAPRSA